MRTTASSARRSATLPVLAVLAVAVVLVVQLSLGGGRYEPLRPADPCTPRAVSSQSTGLDGLTEQLVLVGVDEAACRLGVSREALTLDLAQPRVRSEAEIEALRAGLRAGVRRLDAAGALPPASDLVDEALGSADLNRFVEVLVRALPDRVVDAALKTDDVLLRTVDDLDLRALLDDLGDPGDLQALLESAVTRAVREALVDRLRDLL